jgi:hypothetical protein
VGVVAGSRRSNAAATSTRPAFDSRVAFPQYRPPVCRSFQMSSDVLRCPVFKKNDAAKIADNYL